MGLVSDLITGGSDDKNAGGKILAGLRKKKRSANTSSSSDDADLPSFHRGGRVKRTGPARLKKGETVMTKPQMRRMRGKARD